MYFNRNLGKSRVNVIVGLLMASIMLGGWLALKHNTNVNKAETKTVASPTDLAAEKPLSVPERTIASEWRWDDFEEGEGRPTETERPSAESPVLFDVTVIYEALQEVRVDESGDVVLDDTALKALDEALLHGNLDLTATDLEELQKLIRIGLPGTAGEQTAKVVGDYYNFLEAKDEFNAVYEAPGAQRHYEAEYEELVALRELYLGREVASKLFVQADKDARYMIESMQLAADDTLSEEERMERQREIAARHHEADEPDVQDWDRRTAAFEEQKRHILAANLTEEQEQQQIEQLLREHFSDEEIATANLLDESRGD